MLKREKRNLMSYRILSVFVFLIMGFSTVFGQVIPNQADIDAELKRRGITQQQLEDKLREKGVDLNTMDPTDPADLQVADKAIRESLNELEAENGGNKNDNAESGVIKEISREVAPEVSIEDKRDVIQSGGDEILDAVEDGATVEEAISEAIAEELENSLPPATTWGQQVFRDKKISVYQQSRDAKPPSSYVLGAGDRIGVSIWGYSQENAIFEINDEGYIKPEAMPRIYLKGITFGKAKKLLQSRFSNNYRFKSEEFEVTLNFSRTITVNIVGEVFNYGSFTLPARNTAFNALVATGGPTAIGSVRNIKLIRAGEENKRIDIYQFLLDPSAEERLFLQENDYISVPIAEKLVEIGGAVKRPFKYELIEGENLGKLIDFAGGLKLGAITSRIKVIRTTNGRQTVINADYDAIKAGGKDFELRNGDIVEVMESEIPYENFVNIRGTVQYPGEYELVNDMRIGDLIEKAIFKKEAETRFAYLSRENPDGTTNVEKVDLQAILADKASPENILLDAKDILTIYPKARFVDNASISITGAVRDGGTFTFDPEEDLRLVDVILLAGGLRPGAVNFAYLERQKLENPEEKELIKADISIAMNDLASPENIVLKPFDKIIIGANSTYTDEFQVSIEGEVRNPGRINLSKGLGLKDVLLLAGGLKLEASKANIEIYRVFITGDGPTRIAQATLSINDSLDIIEGGEEFSLEPFDEIIVRRLPDFELQRYVEIKGEVTYPGKYPIIQDNERLSSLLERSGRMTFEAFPDGATLKRTEKGQEGFVLLKLSEISKKSGKKYDFILKPGDIIEIPKQKDLVTLETENTNITELVNPTLIQSGKVNVAYEKGKNAKFYVNEYMGGVNKIGRKSRISVLQPNGQFKKARNYLIFKTYPEVEKGGIVSVGAKPEKVKKEKNKEEKEKINWGEVVRDTLAIATSALTLILLVERVNQ